MDRPNFKIWRKDPSGKRMWLTVNYPTWDDKCWSEQIGNAHEFTVGQEQILADVDQLAEKNKSGIGYTEVRLTVTPAPA